MILPLFSHIYVEQEISSDERTTEVVAKFPKAQVVEVEKMADVTQRRSASWSDQKRSPKLVLAKKRSDLIYPCTEVAPNFGHPNFYYAVPMQNCLYDCEYCYLQGMYTSPHLVYFVNQEEMIEKARAAGRKLGSLYLCIAYDNDVMAVENLFGVVGRWVEGLRATPEVTVEVRTKSANFRPLSKLKPADNFILAWTLSPEQVVKRFEAKTPPLATRLKALKDAAEHGWRVRLCLDPLIPVKDWREHYAELFRTIDQAELWSQFEDASYGLFRMPKPFLRQAKKVRPDSALLHSADTREQRGLYTLSGTDQGDLLKFVGDELRKRMDKEKVWET